METSTADQPDEGGELQNSPNVLREEEYGYNPDEDIDGFPPVACTISEFVLLSLGIDHRKFLVGQYANARGDIELGIVRSDCLGLAISSSDILAMDGKERQAASRYNQINRALALGVLAEPGNRMGEQRHLWWLPYVELRQFAMSMRWELPTYMKMDSRDEQRTTDSSAVSLAFQFLEHLLERQGDDQLQKLTVLIEAYIRIHEQGEALSSAENDVEVILKRLHDTRYHKQLGDTPAKHMARILKTVRDSRRGRPLGSRDSAPRHTR